MSKKKSKARPIRVRVKTQDMRRILVRLPEDLATWLDDTASDAGLSRDAFFRQMVGGMRKGFELAAVEGTKESTLFRKLETELVRAAERGTEEAVRSMLTNAGAVAEVVASRERPPFIPRKRG